MQDWLAVVTDIKACERHYQYRPEIEWVRKHSRIGEACSQMGRAWTRRGTVLPRRRACGSQSMACRSAPIRARADTAAP